MVKPKKGLYVTLLAMVLLLATDCGKEEAVVICGSGCSTAAPWRVESLDLGLPCFATKQQCMDWAATHGYGDRNCVMCD